MNLLNLPTIFIIFHLTKEMANMIDYLANILIKKKKKKRLPYPWTYPSTYSHNLKSLSLELIG